LETLFVKGFHKGLSNPESIHDLITNCFFSKNQKEDLRFFAHFIK
jgi:hypothetical protein